MTTGVNLLVPPMVRSGVITTAPPPAFPTLNEPAGMTELYHNVGTVIDFVSAGWTENIVNSAGFLANMTVRDDATNPLGTGKALRMNHPLVVSTDDETRGDLRVSDWTDFTGVTLGNAKRLYMRFRLKFNGDSPGGKIFYAGLSPEAHDSVFTDFFVTIETSGGMGMTTQNVGRGVDSFMHWPGGANAPFPSTGAGWESDWHVLEVLLTAESSVGAQDGSLEMWLDDTKLHSDYVTLDDALYWSAVGASESSFNGFHLLLNVNQGGSPRSFAHTIDWGEIYFSGSESRT